MMNGYEYTDMDAILAGSFRAAIYCRLSKDDDLDGESASTQTSGGLMSLLDMFSGGAFSNASIFALGIMPYISASIVM